MEGHIKLMKKEQTLYKRNKGNENLLQKSVT